LKKLPPRPISPGIPDARVQLQESAPLTTIVSVRRNGKVVMGGDGQVSLGNTVMKGNARKVRRIFGGKVIAGFAGGTADAFTLLDRFEGKLEKHQGNLLRASVEMAKDWRTDRVLRRLEAMLLVAHAVTTLIITGNRDMPAPAGGMQPSDGKPDRHLTSDVTHSA